MRIATCCPPSSPAFLGPIEDVWRAAGHEVRRFDDGQALDADRWGDVVWCEWARLHAIQLSQSGTKPLVLRVLGYEAWEPEFLAIDWSRVRRAIFHCSAHYAAAVRIAPAIAGVPMTYLASPIDFDRFALQPHSGDGRGIGFVGQKDARKNLFAALQVLALLPGDYTLHVAGDCEDGRLREYHDHAIDAMGLRERVRFYGRVEDLAPWWAPLDYCLVASTSDQGPRSLAEAMALGVMPVVHDYPGAATRVPESSLWRRIDEAAQIIRGGYPLPPAEYRRVVYEGRKNPERMKAAILAAVETA